MSKEVETSADAENQSAMLDRAKDLLLESGNCAQTSFSILNDEFDLGGDQSPYPISWYRLERRDMWCCNWVTYGLGIGLWTG
jgi:hypothetical protein